MNENILINENELDNESLVKAIKLVHQYTGITMTPQKKSMLEGRLKRRMRTLGIDKYKNYLDFLQKTPTEVEFFVNTVTTNETSFFRTPRVWEYFQKSFLPEWYKKNRGKVLKLWSAASSSGEEAYSMAICCYEFKLFHPDFQFKIMASDISTDILNEAKAGIYSQKSVLNLKLNNKPLFDKYIIAQDDGTFTVREDIKKCPEFFQHNLFEQLKHKRYFDLVFLRNVLIYFELKDQQKVLRNLSETLVNQGPLIIGESESLNAIETPFKYQSACVYTKES